MASNEVPYLTVGTEVSAKYKGAFCEAKIKKVQKTVRCKVSPKDGGPQLSVEDDAIKGELRIGALVKVKQPDSGQFIDGTIQRFIDMSLYTVVFDDGDITTLKRTMICLKGDKHFIESETLDQLPLTHPERFGSPVHPSRKERRRRSGLPGHASPSTINSDSSDEESSSTRRSSPRSSKTHLNVSKTHLGTQIGKVVSLELGDKRKWCPGLVIKPQNTDSESKNKNMCTVKSFKDSKTMVVSEKQLKEFNKDSIKLYPNDKMTQAAVDKAVLFKSTGDLPNGWRRDDLLGSSSSINKPQAQESDSESGHSEDDITDDQRDRFILQLYKFMDDRSTPINKPAQLYNKDVDLYKLSVLVEKSAGFNKVSSIDGKWKDIGKRLGFTGITVGTEMKLLYKRYLLAYEDFKRKMGNPVLFEGSRSGKSRNQRYSSPIINTRETADNTSGKASPAHSEENVKKVRKTKAEDKTTPTKSTPTPKTPTGRGRGSRVKQEYTDDQSDSQINAPDKQTTPTPPSTSSTTAVKRKSNDEPRLPGTDDILTDDDTPVSTLVEVEFPPGTKVKVKYGRQKKDLYDAKVVDIKITDDKSLIYTVHYNGWNQRYDEHIKPDRIVSVIGKYEGKRKLELFKEGFGSAGRLKRTTKQTTVTSASSTGSATPEPPKPSQPEKTQQLTQIERKSTPQPAAEKKSTPQPAAERKSTPQPAAEKKSTPQPAAEKKSTPQPAAEKKSTPQPAAEKKSTPLAVTEKKPTALTSAEKKATATTSAEKKSTTQSAASSPKPTSAITKTPVTTVVERARSTRMSASGISLTRSTRARGSTDSIHNVPQLPLRRRSRRASQSTENESKSAEPELDDISTELESEADIDMAAPPPAVKCEATVTAETTCKQEVNKCVEEKSEEGGESADERDTDSVTTSVPDIPLTSQRSSRTPRRTAVLSSRKSRSQTSSPVTQTSRTNTASNSANNTPTRTADSPVLGGSTNRMSSAERSRMIDVIDQVAMSGIEEPDVPNTTTTIPLSTQPPVKKKKIETEESLVITQTVEGPHAGLEDLKHKKSASAVKSDIQSEISPPYAPAQSIHEDDKEITEETQVLPSEITSGLSTHDFNIPEEVQEQTTPDVRTDSIDDVLKRETAESEALRFSEAVDSLTLLSQEAEKKIPTSSPSLRTRSTQRTRRTARRSPKHRAAAAADFEFDEKELSPAKQMKISSPRPHRIPKYNFNTEELLGSIVGQEARISFLTDQMNEIKKLYSDVKSNLNSLERRRRRSRREDRRHEVTCS